MDYSEFVEVYEKLASTKSRLEKSKILSDFLKDLKKNGKKEWIYLLLGKVAPDYDSAEMGISTQLTLKAIAYSFGINESDVLKEYKKIGDLGEVAFKFSKERKQSTLAAKKLSVDKVFDSLAHLTSVDGKGSVDKKMNLISEILSHSDPLEAKYIIRTLISDLRIGIAAPTIVDAISQAFFNQQGKTDITQKIQEAYDLANDFALVFEAASKGINEVEKIGIVPGRPLNVMLAVKVTSIEEAFDVCGKPAAIEQKYDGFRMLINKKDSKISLFTRRLENVTNQFPDVVSAVLKYVKGENFILDSEVVGYDSKTKKYLPFESISQRIKRKYDIDKLVKGLPVEINIFDVLYHNGKSFIDIPFTERRNIVEKIIIEKDFVIRPSVLIVTDSEEEAMKFYQEALKLGEEGIMVKRIDAPYKQGRRVGYMVKLKPLMNDLDLVIVGAEHGTGKRGGWLTSYIIACRSGDDFVEIGKVSSGLKEKEEEGTTYAEMTELIKPLIIEEKADFVKIKPEIVVSVNYQNIQESPSYSSGYALRFPRITHYRPDRNVNDIATLADIKKVVNKNKR